MGANASRDELHRGRREALDSKPNHVGAINHLLGIKLAGFGPKALFCDRCRAFDPEGGGLGCECYLPQPGYLVRVVFTIRGLEPLSKKTVEAQNGPGLCSSEADRATAEERVAVVVTWNSDQVSTFQSCAGEVDRETFGAFHAEWLPEAAVQDDVARNLRGLHPRKDHLPATVAELRRNNRTLHKSGTEAKVLLPWSV